MNRIDLLPFVAVRRSAIAQARVRGLVSDALLAAARLPEHDASLQAAFEEARARQAEGALAAARAPAMLAALTAASRSFVRDLSSLVPRNDKRTRHAVTTALRYLTRGAFKTSPFGRFVEVDFASVEEAAHGLSYASGPAAFSRARVHARLRDRLWERTRRSPPIGARVRWAPLLATDEDSVVYFVVRDGWLKLQRVSGPVARSVTTAAAVGGPVDASVEGDLAEALPRLFELGLVEWDARAPSGEPDDALIASSESNRALVALARAYGEAVDATDRIAAQDALMRAALDGEGASPPTDAVEEDRFGGARASAGRARLTSWIEDLDALVTLAPKSDVLSARRALATWYRARWGARSSPFHEVYAHWQREAPVTALTGEASSDEAHEIARALALDTDGAHDVARVVRWAAERPSARVSPCWGAYLLVGTESSGARAALQGISHGFGRGFGRFLFGAPPAVRDAVVRRNRCLSPEHEFFELAGSPGFGADLHPDVGLRTFVLPGYLDDGRARLDATALVVRPRDGDGLLELVDGHRSKVLFRADLRLTEIAGSGLDELLALLAGFESPNVDALLDAVRAHVARADGDGVLSFARVVAPSGLVLSRRRWRFTRARIEELLRARTALERWRAYARTCRAHGVPDEHFARVARARSTSRASYKPRWVHLGIVELVDDIVRVMARAEGADLVIEEAMPSGGVAVGGEHHTAEIYVEWSRRGWRP